MTMKTHSIRTSFPLGLGLAVALAGAGCDPTAASGTSSSSGASTAKATSTAKSALQGVFTPGCLMPPGATGLPESLPIGDSSNYPFCTHVDQRALPGVSFPEVFGVGDALFDTPFNSQAGGGAHLMGDAAVEPRYSRVPRADLPGFANRATGPNSSSCASCHAQPVDDGAGDNSANAVRDPKHKGDVRSYITRNTPHVMGMGALQLLAEEMTTELWALRDGAKAQAAASGNQVTVALKTKGIN